MSSARGLAVLAILLHAAASAHASAVAPAPALRAESSSTVDTDTVRKAVNRFFGSPVSPFDLASAFVNVQPLTSLLTRSAEVGSAVAPSADSERKKVAEAEAEADIASAVSALSSLTSDISAPPPAAAHEGSGGGDSDGAASAGGRVAGNVVALVAAAALGYLVTF